MLTLPVYRDNGSTLEDPGSSHAMLAQDKTDEEDAALKIPYCALTVKEALYLLTNYYEGYFDAGKQSVVLTG